MDAVLRGQRIKHVEYMQVGKGRDMGLLSILIFFSKLSMGTAMMTSSRQALRLGQRAPSEDGGVEGEGEEDGRC